MKYKLLLLSAIAVLATFNAQSQVVITGFGTSQYTETFTDFAAGQSASAYSISGTDFGNSAYGSFASVVIGSPTQLTLLGTFTGTATSSFQIELFDVDGDSKLYQGSFTDFVSGNPTSVILNFLSNSGTFNGTAVSLGFITTGGGSTINLSMDTLSAVVIPEPSTYGLLILGAGILVFMVRRRTAKA